MSGVLRAEGLTCGIGRRPVLRDVGLDLRPGEVLGLVGANGTGKSTLLRTLAGLAPPLAGRVLLDGDDLHRLRARERSRRLAFVAQDEHAPADLLVGELVALGRVPHGRAHGGADEADRAAVVRALALVDLADAAHQPLDRLSGGERRRALLARGLAQEADVLMLDEPTNHLDVRHRVALMRLLRELAANGRTVAVALHDLDLAGASCDRVAVLHDGALAHLGPPEDVLTPRVLHDVFGVLATRVTHPRTGRRHLLLDHDESETHP